MPGLDDDTRGTAAPGDQPGTEPAPSRRLAEPPSARYAAQRMPSTAADAGPSGLRAPLLRATGVAVAGAALMTVVGAVLASPAGLLFAAGIAGGGIGLVLARAAVPHDDAAPVPRARLARIAVGLSLAAVVLAAAATWVIARAEGGVLGPIDYLLTTFGLFVPSEAVIAAVAAWWGASSGPIQS